MKQFGYPLLFLFLLCILMCGCDTMSPATVTFVPSGKNPIASIKPLTILVQVEDQRPPDERDSVFRHVAIGGSDSWNTKKPVPLIVQDALVSELSKCGHRAVVDSSKSTDARLKIVLRRFRAFYSIAGAALSAQIDAEILITNEARKTDTPPFQISGDYQRTTYSFKNPNRELNAALAEFVHNLTFDSRLVEALQ